MADKTLRDLLFFRHSIERKRSDGYFAFNLLKAPYESRSSGSSGCWEGATTYELQGSPREGLTVLVGRFPRQVWLSAQMLEGDVGEIAEANESVSRLEFLHLRFGTDGRICLLKITKKNKLLIQFDSPANGEFNISGDEFEPEWNGLDATEALKAIRERFDFPSPLRTLTVDESDRKYQVINERGRILKPLACTVAEIDCERPIENLAAAEALAAAIENCDAGALRAALEAGASATDPLPESSLVPLLTTLFCFSRPGAEECAQTLIDAGAPVQGRLPGCFGFDTSEACLQAARLLIAHGADVNETNNQDESALSCAVVRNNLAAIKWLMENGASPGHGLIYGENVVPWVQKRFSDTNKRSELELYAEMLTLLTGNEVRAPEVAQLPEKLALENARFLRAVEAQKMLAELPNEIGIEPNTSMRPGDPERFAELHAALETLGFIRHGEYIDDVGLHKMIVAYVHPTERLDAIVQDYWWLEFVGCRLLAYGDDGHLFVCSNSDLMTPEAPILPSVTEREFPDAEPSVLMQRMADVVKERGVGLMDNPSAEFMTRFLDGYHRVLTETKTYFANRLAEEQILIDGVPPLFERRQIYRDFSGRDDPSRCTMTEAEESLEKLNENRRDDCFSTSMAVMAAFDLLTLQRLQFAGAPEDDEFVAKGCTLGVKLFENLKTKWKRALKFRNVHDLWRSLILCQAATARGHETSDRFSRICNDARPKMATRELRHGSEIPLPLGQWTIVFISDYRKRAVPKLGEWRASVAKSRNKRAKQLLKSLDAWKAGDANAFVDHLSESLTEYQKLPAENGCRQQTYFALPESLLWNAAVGTNDLDVRLDQELEDLMMTGFTRHTG